ncbi:PLP-dependent aminotransferase family protein [Phytohabitans sp. LJ34]|uniref:aminotransferase-like domain-containing protein n=1 Tax=Phytohabitans sp. LJ34 TaxID=3452217 RepID=UPI003F8ABA45
MRSREPLTIPIQLDPEGEPRRSLHAQITDQMIVAVDQGRLPGGMRMPSTRTLATELGISRGVASAAYTELLTRGYLEARRGSGTYVAARTRGTPRRTALGPPPTVDLTPGRLAGELFPTAAWTTAWRRAASAPPPARVPVLGLPELRNALVRQVLWPTGVSLDRHLVVITNSAAHALRLALAALGRGPVGLELPAPPAIHAVAGTPIPLPVDGQGATLDGVPPDCRVLVVAPDGQLPLGQPMPLERRRALVAWAERTGGHTVVLTPAGTPSSGPTSLPGLLAAAGVDRTVLAGTIGEHLTPALQLGYAVVPAALAAPVTRLLRDSGETPPYVLQLAAAKLLRDGTIQAHSRGVARLYAYKRQFLESTLAPFGDRIRLGPPETTGATPLYLPPGADADEVAEMLAAKAVRVRTLARYYWGGSPAPHALVIAYGHPTGAALRHALAALTEVLETI